MKRYTVATGFSGVEILKTSRNQVLSLKTIINYQREGTEITHLSMPNLDIDNEEGEMVWSILRALSEKK
jgi:hypothetical protein